MRTNIDERQRPGKLFTANKGLMVAEVGELKRECLKQIVEAIVSILRTSVTP